MKVLEVKNNLVKIEFSPEDGLFTSCFLIIEDTKSKFVAQVMNLKGDENGKSAIAKLLFTFGDDGVLRNYNGSIPDITSEISILATKELLDILPVNEPLKLGKIAQQKTIMSIDKSALDGNFLICSNNMENTKLLLDYIIEQLAQTDTKSIIFDLDGKVEAENKIKFTSDFKIPLNYDTINFIYENDLKDIDPTSKAIIQDIFIEVQEYTKTVEGNFIPFDTFINVVDQQYKATKVPQLVLLKNKLSKYQESNIFAQTIEEAQSLEKAITLANNSVIDLSSTDIEPLQEQILELAYNIINNGAQDTYIFIKLNEENANKPLLKLLTTNNKTFTTIICGHEFKYIKELKELAKNIVFFAPLTLQHDFAAYNTFLNKLNGNEYIVVGDLTQQIPFILQPEMSDIENEDYQHEFTDETNDIADEITIEEPTIEEMEITPETAIFEDIKENTENEITVDSPQTDEEINYEENVESSIEEPTDVNETNEDISIEELSQLDEKPEDQEPDKSQSAEDENEIIENNGIDTEESNEDVIDEVDSVINTTEPEEEEEEEEEEDNVLSVEDLEESEAEGIQQETTIEPELSENTISLDELAEPDTEPTSDTKSSAESKLEIPEPEIVENTEDMVEEVKQPTTNKTPVIPIYNADEINNTAVEEFKPGDEVSHPKYGKGVVERMINYGSKKLCSIMFENNNRRLLDPTISEIKKV